VQPRSSVPRHRSRRQPRRRPARTPLARRDQARAFAPDKALPGDERIAFGVGPFSSSTPRTRETARRADHRPPRAAPKEAQWAARPGAHHQCSRTTSRALSLRQARSDRRDEPVRRRDGETPDRRHYSSRLIMRDPAHITPGEPAGVGQRRVPELAAPSGRRPGVTTAWGTTSGSKRGSDLALRQDRRGSSSRRGTPTFDTAARETRARRQSGQREPRPPSRFTNAGRPFFQGVEGSPTRRAQQILDDVSRRRSAGQVPHGVRGLIEKAQIGSETSADLSGDYRLSTAATSVAFR